MPEDYGPPWWCGCMILAVIMLCTSPFIGALVLKILALVYVAFG